MLTFEYAWLFALLPLPFVVRWLVPAYRESRASLRIPFVRQIAAAAGSQPGEGAAVRRRGTMQAVLFVTVWCLLVAAVSKPQWLEDPLVRTLPTRDLLLAVDLSGSMEARDFQGADGETVDRLTAVKRVLGEFLVEREGDRVGLVVFGNAAFVQAPFTTDLQVVRQLLDETAIRMAGPKTAFGDAIGLGITLFERSELEQRVMIALTDGNDTGSLVPPAQAARIAADKGIVIHTVAIGDPASVGEEALDETALKEVAEITRGGYFYAADTGALEQIYETLDSLETREVETVTHRPRRDLFKWPFGLALLLAIGYHAWIALSMARLANGDEKNRASKSSA